MLLLWYVITLLKLLLVAAFEDQGGHDHGIVSNTNRLAVVIMFSHVNYVVPFWNVRPAIYWLQEA